MTDVYVGSDGTAPSDGELILEVRGGSLDAYGALYQRHAAAARALARQYVTSDSDADDVVADAFGRVLGVLQQGNGPDSHFRAYLFTVLRRLAADLARRAKRTMPTDDDGTFERALGSTSSPEDPALSGFENTVVARAYEGLPERWQAVLWYTEIEQLSPAQVAPILGLTPNGVAALAYRAREGLRVGYLQEHLTAEPADTCRSVNPLLGGYVRGSLARREVAQVETHLEDCGECRTLVLELSDVAHGMRTVIAPLVLGVAGMALMGALPVGLVTGGAVGASAGSAATGAGTGVTTGATTTTGVTTGAGTGATTGATATTATTGATTATGAGSAGGAVATTAGATAATATTTAATATTAVAATTAGVSGATVVASAGAVAVASIGVVTVLGALASSGPTDVSEPPPHSVAGEPWPAVESEPETAEGEPAGEPSEDLTEPTDPTEPIATDPTNPANVPPFVQDAGLVLAPVDVPAPAQMTVAVADPGAVLEPRIIQQLSLQVANAGATTAVDSRVLLSLPTGMTLVPPSSPSGASVVAPAPTAQTLPCTPTAASSQEALCALGTLEPGSSRTVSVPVVVRAGGAYTVTARTWAEGVAAQDITLPPAKVAYFGPELTARVDNAAVEANPGRAGVSFSVHNSGDRPAASGWTARVRIPAGLVPQDVRGDLTCALDGAPTDPGSSVWQCTGGSLAPGTAASGRVGVVADGTTTKGDYEVTVAPGLPDDGPTVRSAAFVSVPPAWEGADAGAGTIAASCRATGGLSVADAVVTATFRNLTKNTLAVAFEAAGTSVSASGAVAPGGSTTAVAPDGLRVPSGKGTWTLSTVVGGTTYTRTVAAGSHGSAECYSPRWDVDTTSTVVNDGGVVRIEGTVTNRTNEPMRVSMRAAGSRTDQVRLDAGETVTLGRTTSSTSVDAGSATFSLSRWVVDHDGDRPRRAATPSVSPTASYPAATIAPRAGAATATGTCSYDAGDETSWQTFTVPLDNSRSSLPATFTVRAGPTTEKVRVAAGDKTSVDVRVPWGTGTGTVTADGRAVSDLDVAFDRCTEAPGWPAVDITAAAQCEAGSAQVVVDVAGTDHRTWTTTLLRGGSSVGSQKLAAAGSTRFVVDTGSLSVRAGKVTVRLERTIEGEKYAVERTARHDRARCVVQAPQARLDEGSVELDRYGDYATSWRHVAVVLDNSASNVKTRFHVVGPHGVDESVTVRAGETRTVAERRVDGRLGGTWTVTAGDWSTTLEASRFTAAEAGWCADRIAWGVRYDDGDVRSWNGLAYSYSAPTKSDSDSDDAGDRKKKHRAWMGEWKRWSEIGLCEYR